MSLLNIAVACMIALHFGIFSSSDATAMQHCKCVLGCHHNLPNLKVPAGVAGASLPQAGPSASSAKMFDAGATTSAAGKLDFQSLS